MKDVLGPGIEELKAAEIAQFKEAVARGDGEPITLNSEAIGEPLFLFSNFYNHPFPELDSHGVIRFGDCDKLLLVSVHGVPDPFSNPFGLIASKIKGKTASLDGWHDYLKKIVKIQGEDLKTRKKAEPSSNWFWNIAFFMDGEHRRKGVGSLLVASAIVAADSQGALLLNQGNATEEAKRVWEKFGVDNASNNNFVPVEQLLRHPRVDESIARFV